MNQLSQSITEANVITELIPQRPPMVMVDAFHHFSEGKVIAGITPEASNLFAEDSYLNASGIIEHMAQTVALYTGYQYYLKKQPAPTGYIGAIKNIQIHQLPTLTSELRTTAEVLHEIMGVTLVKAETYCDDTLIATSEMKTVIASS
ncbi:hypothetical protein [Altibacter sp. HG106]|uniref:hypothetical protein n=1 Tax=Altibacter sp. HG106 TaxID=3023937 RepID=UPI00234FF5BF|nr:hypothetical protein [Altibacter sp. HG106]MDC7994700.1 hypothetical protein [Altibacter sp. HG106]